jgi:sugar/nucleoside kinase (ribokinase family)
MPVPDRTNSPPRQSSPAVELLVTTSPAPVIVGTGLLALDVVYGPESGGTPTVAAGGTCGNVLAGLAFLGWDAYPVGRLAADGAGDRIREDLARWRVHLEFASLAPTAGSPVIVQRISRDTHGAVSHKFSLSCQGCGRWLPTYAPVPAAAMSEAVSALPHPDVCFIDRASAGAAVLSEWAADAGAVVYVEPSGRSTPAQLARIMASAHIVKYSAEHRDFVEQAKRQAGRAFNPVLEVVTQGAAGLRYRLRDDRGWQVSSALPVPQVRDTAGAGDWCTVGILHLAGQGGAPALEYLPPDLVLEALRVGQALSAWTCQYEGARGGMHRTSRADLASSVERLLRADAVLEVAGTGGAGGGMPDDRVALCRDCTDEALVE